MPRSLAKPLFLRAWRAGVLVAITWLMHQQYAFFSAQQQAGLGVERVLDFFPEAASLGSKDPVSGVQKVLNRHGDTLGLVTQTAPLSNNVIGYSGPTNTLIAMDAQGRVTGLRVLHSGDTADHLATVLRKRSFFEQFKGLKLGALTELPKVDTVSGATLTSDAIAQGILQRLGGDPPSLRFPEEITLAEVQQLKPEAAALKPEKHPPGLFLVQNAAGETIARVTRTAPHSDSIIGYKGPTDTLLLLTADGTKIESFRLRKSFDTEEYVGYVTGDRFFAPAFEGMTVEKLGSLEFNQAGIEGATGATETSWAVAEGLKRRAAGLASAQAQPDAAFTFPVLRAPDIGLLLVIALSLLMTFTSLRGKRWARWVHQAALIGYAGFYGGMMISQGLLTGWARHGVPWQTAPVLVLLAALALALPLLTRRQFYCHHYCPHGALQQWLSRRLRKHVRVPHALGIFLEKVPLLLLVFILLIVMLGLNVDLNALEAFDAWLFLVAGWGTIVVAVAGLVFSLFTPMAYCRYGCPTGALLKFVRYAGEADGFGKKDLLALALVLGAAVLHWQREWVFLWLS